MSSYQFEKVPAKQTWDHARGAPPVHHFNETGPQPANRAGGEVSPSQYLRDPQVKQPPK
jgi:hypothetical protein